MEAMTAIRMPAATTWANLQIPCSDVNANLAMLEMDTSVERTQIWMDGLMLILCVWRMRPITARRLGKKLYHSKNKTKKCKFYINSFS